MSINVPVFNIRMIDSLNFIPMPLAEMPGSFGETELAKGYFPHLFNRKENQQAVLPHLPDVQYYTPDSMKPESRAMFLTWYEQNKDTPFDFQKELLRYCQSDVDILRKCCLRFRKLFMDLTRERRKQGNWSFWEVYHYRFCMPSCLQDKFSRTREHSDYTVTRVQTRRKTIWNGISMASVHVTHNRH